ncbi:MAG: helix-hairpin-helix domain-containing protein [Candidatus Bathyarchaeia archaeon]
MKRRDFRFLALICFCVLFISAGLFVIAEAQQKDKTIKGKTVNINTATADEISKSVPLITPELAKKIVEYREKNGKFQTLEELLQVEVFSRDRLRRIKPFLLLEGVGGKDCTC